MLPPSPLPAFRAAEHGLRLRPTVLAVDDDEDTLELLHGQLHRAGYTMLACDSAESALKEPRLGEVDVVVSDVHLGGMDGIGLCEELATRCPGVPVVVVTAFATTTNERAALAAGAFDFVPKLFDTAPRFLDAIERAAEHRKRQLDDLERLTMMSGGETLDAPAMKRLYSAICEAAACNDPVSIGGGTSTLRSAIARAIHEASPRRRRPFVAHCITTSVGPLSDAQGRSLLSQAEGGTVFLEGIDRISSSLQHELLRVVGDDPAEPIPGSLAVDGFRVIIGNADGLEDAVDAGQFSAALSRRLAARCIELSTHRTDDLSIAQAS